MVSLGVQTVWIPLVVVVMTGWFALQAWRQRPKPGTTALALVLGAVCVWNAVRIGSHLTTGFMLSVVFSNLDYTMAMATSALALVFALEFTGHEHWLRARRLAALSALPAFDAVLIWSNPLHRLFRTNAHIDMAVEGHLAFETGMAYHFHFAVAYAYATVASLLLVVKVVRTRTLRRYQSLAVLVAVAAPLVGHLFSRVGITDALFAPSFAVTGIALYVAVVNFQLTDVTPVARATVMDRLDVGVLVVDRDERLADINGAGKHLVGRDADASLVGKPLSEVLMAVPEVYDRYREDDETSEVVTAETDRERRALQVDISPFEDRLGRRVGKLVLLQDVTGRECRERELEHKNKQLSTLAGVVSHDLRNPLQVAAGHAAMLDDEAAAPIESSLERMEAIVEDVLAMVHQEGEATETEPVDLADVATRAWEQVESGSATVAIETDATIEADPDRLQRLFENLFRNAVEHGSTSPPSQTREDAVEHGSTNPPSHAQEDAVEHGSTSPPSHAQEDAVEHATDDVDGPLTVTVGEFESERDTSVGAPFGFFVADDGPGIPEEDREKVLETGYTTESGGTGLGLAIVENIATAHGWSISVTESEDGGARFEFADVERIGRAESTALTDAAHAGAVDTDDG